MRLRRSKRCYNRLLFNAALDFTVRSDRLAQTYLERNQRVIERGLIDGQLHLNVKGSGRIKRREPIRKRKQNIFSKSVISSQRCYTSSLKRPMCLKEKGIFKANRGEEVSKIVSNFKNSTNKQRLLKQLEESRNSINHSKKFISFMTQNILMERL